MLSSSIGEGLLTSHPNLSGMTWNCYAATLPDSSKSCSHSPTIVSHILLNIFKRQMPTGEMWKAVVLGELTLNAPPIPGVTRILQGS